MNLGEDGKPYAVLVGKDGQEVDQVAGEGVVEILREREEDDGEDDRPWSIRGVWWDIDDEERFLLVVEPYLREVKLMAEVC
jgi:hypothetical protein